MQTIKTAAVMLLMLSVIVGVGMSLTAPPEALSPEVEEMLMSEDFAGGSLEDLLPPSLAELGVDSGTATSDGFDAGMSTESAGQINPLTTSSATVPEDSASFAMADNQTVESALEAFDSGPGITNSLSDQPNAATLAKNDTLPAQVAMASDAARFSTRDDPSGYPATNATFNLPDPANLEAFMRDNEVVQASSSSSMASGDVAQATVEIPATGLASDEATIPSDDLNNALATADRQYVSDRRKDALATLSIFYGTPNLTGEQRSELLSRLDPLAAEVIYSKEHLLERPYRVKREETLMSIAEQYEIPWELLANINEIRDPVAIIPGTELKVVRGPFRAEVDLTTQELTLFLGDLYAGRFPVAVGSDPTPSVGTFTIQEKQRERTFYDRSGLPIAPGDPSNPYGRAWLDLGGQMCIHGSPSTTKPTENGCISLAADYADDLYSILNTGSSITIRR
ncbi:MAG: L,D-transpeptidase family protein [Planctomycetota bacterium]